MLTVIVIIVILAGVLLPTVNRAFARAKRAQARQDLASLKAAVDAYYTEYSRLPIITGLSPGVLCSADQAKRVYIGLMASTNAYIAGFTGPANPGKYTFLEGNSLNDNGEFIDPWGSQYLLQFARSDGRVPVRYASSGLTNHYVNAVGRSLGPDRKVFTEDDVLSVGGD